MLKTVGSRKIGITNRSITLAMDSLNIPRAQTTP
jgi:hypothetical protein